MTDHPGPEFLPYPLPAVTQQTVQLPPPPAMPPTTGRWSRALDGVPPLGVLSIGTGLGALVLLVLVTGIAGRPGPGAVVTTLAAVVSLLAGWAALRGTVVKDSKTLVVGAQSLGALSALLAAMVYAGSGSDVQPVTPPSPQPTVSSTPTAGPTPSADPGLPPGAANGFGVPTNPGPPSTDDPSALGTLQGHVVDTAGKPIKGAVVSVTRATAGGHQQHAAVPHQGHDADRRGRALPAAVVPARQRPRLPRADHRRAVAGRARPVRELREHDVLRRDPPALTVRAARGTTPATRPRPPARAAAPGRSARLSAPCASWWCRPPC